MYLFGYLYLLKEIAIRNHFKDAKLKLDYHIMQLCT